MGLQYSDHLVPTTGMIAWYRFKSGVDGHHIIYDESGNSRTLTGNAGNAPVLTEYNNENYGWYFDGTRDPLVYTGAVTVKHAFIVAAAEGAAFDLNRGLITGPAAGDLVVSEATGTEFFDFSGTYPDMVYRKSNVVLANASQAAPMNNTLALIELSSATGFALDGIQLGQQKALGTRLWKGIFMEGLFSDRVYNDAERARLYQYFAKMYHIWEADTTSGLNIFPFTQNWGSPDVRRKKVLGDVAEDGSTMTYRTKGGLRRYPDLSFERRLPDEVEAAEEFYDSHYPGTSFTYRDRTILPAQNMTVRFPIDAELDVTPQGPSNFMYKFPLEKI